MNCKLDWVSVIAKIATNAKIWLRAGVTANEARSTEFIGKEKALGLGFEPQSFWGLKQVPQELVVDVVMVLDFGGLDEGAQQTGAAVG